MTTRKLLFKKWFFCCLFLLLGGDEVSPKCPHCESENVIGEENEIPFLIHTDNFTCLTCLYKWEV